jgi:signal peptidase I
VLIAVIGVVAGLVVNQFVLSVGRQASGSMEPTILIGDRYLELKSFYTVGRGDLVVLRPLGGSPAVRVKRVIGLPGDTIACRGGQVFVNGARLDEPYLLADGFVDNTTTDCTEVTVPPGHLYVLGDHRVVSQDSRQLGPISRDVVEARVLTVVWPLRH